MNAPDDLDLLPSPVAARITIEPDDGTLLWCAYNAAGQPIGFGAIDDEPELEERVVRAAGERGVVVRDETEVVRV